MPFSCVQRRRHPRHVFSNLIELRVTPPSANKKISGTAVNINAKGLCLYTADLLTEGETVEIINDVPMAFTKATVKWVKAYSGDFYRVGLTFIE